jgi:hypothetical protein
MEPEENYSEGNESEIDEDDPLAPQLHYIRRQMRNKRVRYTVI